jgi:integrase
MGKRRLKTAADVALRTLSSFFRWAIENHKADYNPARDLPRHRSRVIHRPLSAEGRRKVGVTIQEMMQNGEGNPIYLKALQLSVVTGLRRKSIATMEWDKIEFESKFVMVRDKSYRIHGEKAHPLGPHAIAILKSIPRIANSPWVFPGRDPLNHMALSTLNRVWGLVRTKAGVVAKDEVDRYGNKVKAPKPRLHDLRHTKGAVLGAKNKNTVVGATMGISPEMANRYGTPHDEEVVQANLVAESSLGEDLGILPDLDGVKAHACTTPAPAPTQIVIQINWPYQAKKPKQAKKAPKEPKAPKPIAT